MQGDTCEFVFEAVRGSLSAFRVPRAGAASGTWSAADGPHRRLAAAGLVSNAPESHAQRDEEQLQSLAVAVLQQLRQVRVRSHLLALYYALSKQKVAPGARIFYKPFQRFDFSPAVVYRTRVRTHGFTLVRTSCWSCWSVPWPAATRPCRPTS